MSLPATNHKHFEVVLFDLGNTLIYQDADWEIIFPECNHALLYALRKSGLDLDEKDFMKEIEKRWQAFYDQQATEFIEYTTTYILRTYLEEEGYPHITDSVLRNALDAMYSVSQSHYQTEADAIPTLEKLRKQGYRMGLISNAGDDQDVQTLIDKAGIRAYFDIILTSAAQGIRKPHPRIFQTALAHWGTAPGRAAMVGDTLGADVLGAQNAGIYSIWITRRAGSKANSAHQDTIRPEARIAALSELPELLNGR